MAKKKKNKKDDLPKPRHVWEINPKERVTPSKKIYKRSQEKNKKKNRLNDLNWFGE